MSASDFFFSLDNLDKGISRQLTDAITAHIFRQNNQWLRLLLSAPMQRAASTATRRNNGAF